MTIRAGDIYRVRLTYQAVEVPTNLIVTGKNERGFRVIAEGLNSRGYVSLEALSQPSVQKVRTGNGEELHANPSR